MLMDLAFDRNRAMSVVSFVRLRRNILRCPRLHHKIMIYMEEEVYEEINTEKEELVDNATLVESNSCELHCYDFHTVYSAAYRVPLLYFRLYSIDGQPLVLDELKNLPSCSEKLLLESKWTFITQEDTDVVNIRVSAKEKCVYALKQYSKCIGVINNGIDRGYNQETEEEADMSSFLLFAKSA
ncbi:hypothetical protein FEM48_Zijuj06G0211400 [Ziziphus jujuba var. spinosa]|uniref:Ubiquitin-like-conjugating enzyme ATG10 n=1 Tax=Ziziphus jujuba var. spinosa TaxID=714518 RepID=A0A978VBM6_ZIZJJ|nr:hypothetical protein FEM48_Zijuj06G0211400 [Ziziphus jujuba var. spinosa]